MQKEKSDIDHSHHRKRLYDMIEKVGLENVNDFTALEFILSYIVPRKDTNPLAHRLLKEFGSISSVLEASKTSLKKIHGVGERTAQLLTLLPQITTYYSHDKAKNQKFIKNNNDIINYCRELLKNKNEEEFYAVILDNNFKLLTTKKIAVGNLNNVYLDQKEFLSSLLIINNAKHIVITHCHPSSSPKPSKPDIDSTKSLKRLLTTFNLNLVDHIIIGYNGESFSLRNEGCLNENFINS